MIASKPSIRRRLLVYLLTVTSLTWLAVFSVFSINASHELEEIYDASLAQNAKILFGLVKNELAEDEGELIANISLGDQQHHEYELKMAFWIKIGEDIVRSIEAPVYPAIIEKGFHTYTLDEEQWRVFSLLDEESELVISTAQNLGAREELVDYLMRDSLLLFIIALLVLGVLIWVGIGRGLIPLKTLVDDVSQLSPAHIEPFSVESVPSEVEPLVLGLNGLLVRLSKAIENERLFTSDAAHELRTPLAALKIQLQVAQRAKNEEQREKALSNSIIGIDRATHLVSQLLTMARADTLEINLPPTEIVDLSQIIDDVVDALSTKASQKEIKVRVQRDSRLCKIRGHDAMLNAAVRNIVDNAIRYSHDGSLVSIHLHNHNGGISLVCEDNGPGISGISQDTLFKRFTRGPDTNQSGTGLGLSIVKRICDIHHASVEISSNKGGENGFGIKMVFDCVSSQINNL